MNFELIKMTEDDIKQFKTDIAEFLNEKNPGKDTPEDFIGDGGEGMFVFKKKMK